MAKQSSIATRAKELIGFRRYADAEAVLRPGLRRDPDDADLHALMGDVLGFLGRIAEAEHHVRESVRLRPGHAQPLLTLGELLMATGRRDEAIAALEATLTAPDAGVESYNLYATLMQQYWLLDRAVEVFQRGLAAFPWAPSLLSGLAIVLTKSGRPEATVELLREGVRRHPDDDGLASLLAFTLNYPPGIDPLETLAAHRHYGNLLARRHPAAALPPPGPDQAERRLRVGFVSADFREHACAFFFEPLIASLDRAQFDTCCYSVTEREDQRTAQLRRLAGMWRHCPAADPSTLASRVRSDRIDILIDLAGLTAGGRLEAFSLRAAPVQMTYLGYPNTTGLPTMDYRIVDGLTDPPGLADRYTTEQLLRIDPCFLCYGGLAEARCAPAPPSVERGSITFGSFNALQKVNDPTMRLWARVLQAVPGSTLAIKYLSTGDPATLDRLRSRLIAAGIPQDRQVILGPKAAYRDHLESYAQVDIALDTFPYNGTTTTCEALWMGVPVITLGSSPDVHASRVGLSLLSAAGLPDLIAPSEDDLVRIAAALAADRARLADLRAHLRSRMSASLLCDRAAFGARFGQALRAAWRRACAAQPS